jgi:prephenate dehydrogenase
MKIGFIGLGLIGGSIAKGIKRVHPEYQLLAYSRTRAKLELALSDGGIDEIIDGIDGRLGSCDMLIFCTPVSYIAGYLEQIKPFLSPSCILTDVGSTKQVILKEIQRLGLTAQFVGGHPMAGSEKTGYENASDHLLENAFYVLAPTEDTPDALTETMRRFVLDLGAIPTVLACAEHDRVVAAISHLPHLIACALVNLVQDNDRGDVMKTLAAGGFKDITRIASSSPEMWEQICMTNREAIADFIRLYIAEMEDILADVEQGHGAGIYKLFERARAYRNSISDHQHGSVTRTYCLYCDVVDRPGAIAKVSGLLAGHDISIKNIGILNNRVSEPGALRVEFYDEEGRTQAAAVLKAAGFLAE